MTCSGQDGYAGRQLALVHLKVSDTTDTGLFGILVPELRHRLDSLRNLISLSPFLTVFVATGIDAGELEAWHAELPCLPILQALETCAMQLT